MKFWGACVIAFTGILVGVSIFALQPTQHPIEDTDGISVSPSGKKIAFRTISDRSATSLPKWLYRFFGYRRDNVEVRTWVYSFDKKVSRQVIDKQPKFQLVWSRDGSKIFCSTGNLKTRTQKLSQIDVTHLTTKDIAEASGLYFVVHYRFNANGEYFCKNSALVGSLKVHELRSNASFEIAKRIDSSEWCWSDDGKRVFYVKKSDDGHSVELCETSLGTRTERVFFMTAVRSKKTSTFISNITESPDGRQLGFHLNSWFHVVDIETLSVSKLFQCEHFYACFDWNDSGICYLDRVAGNRHSRARLLIYDPVLHESRVVARGPIQDAKWLNANQIVTKYAEKFIVSFDVATGRATTLFDPTNVTNADEVVDQPIVPTTVVKELSAPHEVVEHTIPKTVANPIAVSNTTTPQPQIHHGSENSPVRSLDEMLTFFPSKYPQGDWSPADLDVEDCWFTSEDDIKLHGWYCRHPEARAVVLFAHGNAGNLSGRAPVLRILRDRLKLSVLIFDYRGYGRSEGTPTVKGVLLDARAARDWLAEREQIAPTQILLLGRSIGGGVMVDLAATDGARGLILESTFTSLRDVAEEMYPKPLVRLVMRNKLNSHDAIADYKGPLLVSHGDADSIIPFSHGQKLFDSANEPKTFVKLDGTDHNDPQTEDYYKVLNQFIDSLQ